MRFEEMIAEEATEIMIDVRVINLFRFKFNL